MTASERGVGLAVDIPGFEDQVADGDVQGFLHVGNHLRVCFEDVLDGVPGCNGVGFAGFAVGEVGEDVDEGVPGKVCCRCQVSGERSKE